MRYPPLNAVRAFEAAGRQQSFLAAAQELHVSAASVSRFVKQLEDDLGQRLFIRQTNGVKLTETGEQYLLAIQPALQTIASVSQHYRQNTRRTLHIIAIPAIAETWLVSRLWRFQQQHKHIEINLVLDDRPIDLRHNETTIWLNYSNGRQAGTQAFALPENHLTLVCHPEIAKSLEKPADIARFPLLVDIDWQSDWTAWLHAANLSPMHTAEHIHFERYSMVVNAAIAGTGVAIGHTALLKTYLQTGTLVAPFAITATPDKQFYAMIADNHKRRSVRQFINWFTETTVFS